MIDWITMEFRLTHFPINAGRITSVNVDGTIEFEIPKKTKVRGTFEASTHVRSVGYLDKDGNATTIQIDGNPSKFLQGHNVFGTDDVLFLVSKWVQAVCQELNIPLSIWDINRLAYGDWLVKRVDINYMFSLPSNIDVRQALNALSQTSRTKYKEAINKKGSIYYNMGSRRWSGVCYFKYEELCSRKKSQKLPFSKVVNERLLQSIKHAIRFEFKLLSLELKDLEIFTGSDLDNYGVNRLYGEKMNAISFTANVRLTDSKLHELPPRLRGTYELWKAGSDLRNCMSRASFYRHKADLKEYGINIDSEETPPETNVIPFVRFVEAKPMSIPAEFEKYCLRAV